MHDLDLEITEANQTETLLTIYEKYCSQPQLQPTAYHIAYMFEVYP